MPENLNLPTLPTLPENTKDPTVSLSIEEILQTARTGMGEISQYRYTVMAAATSSTESQKLTAAILIDAQAKLADISAVATQVVAAKTKITDDQAVIATKSDHIQNAQEHADKVRADLDRTLTAATQQATATEAQKSNAEKAAESAAELLAEVRTAKVALEAEATKIVTARKTAEESAVLTQNLAEKSVEVEERIAAYEKRLAELETQCADQLKTIVGLLPGATSAGLAHAFDERRQTFVKPHDRWQWVFVGSVLAIVALALTGLWHVYNAGTAPTYDELVRLWLARLPIAGALVWLALYASRESALAKRLEEDYGYKSAIASCFEGFRKQMSEVGKDVVSSSPLAKLCGDTLTTVAAPPGRIYDKHNLTVTPASEFTEAAKAAVDVVNAAKLGTK
jgi:hypothetical protein